jgi:dTDP-4-dehydrorhamnose reductase
MRLLITGASGQLGAYLLRELRGADGLVSAWSGTHAGTLFGVRLDPMNLAQPDQVADAFRQARPTTVIHAAAISTIAGCYRNQPLAQQINEGGSALLADLATRTGARLLLVSTDLVFDGNQGWYAEDDVPRPLSAYGRTKAAAEKAVLAAPGSAVARMSLLFGPTINGRPVFFDEQVGALRQGKPVTCFRDEWRTPLSLAAAARALLKLARSDFQGTIHLGGPERLTRLEMARKLAGLLGLDAGVLVAATRDQFSSPEPRPRDTSLNSSRWLTLFPEMPLPPFDQGLREMMAPWTPESPTLI